MNQLRCALFCGLPREVEEEVNKFLDSTPAELHHVIQSESSERVTITIFYTLDLQEDITTR